MNHPSQSLLDCIVSAERNGYTEIFKMSAQGLLSADGERKYSRDKIVINDFHHVVTKGEVPTRTTVFLIETSDHHKGVVVDTVAMKPDERFVHFMSSPGT